MANFMLKITILLRGDRQEWRSLGLRFEGEIGRNGEF